MMRLGAVHAVIDGSSSAPATGRPNHLIDGGHPPAHCHCMRRPGLRHELPDDLRRGSQRLSLFVEQLPASGST